MFQKTTTGPFCVSLEQPTRLLCELDPSTTLLESKRVQRAMEHAERVRVPSVFANQPLYSEVETRTGAVSVNRPDLAESNLVPSSSGISLRHTLGERSYS